MGEYNKLTKLHLPLLAEHISLLIPTGNYVITYNMTATKMVASILLLLVAVSVTSVHYIEAVGCSSNNNNNNFRNLLPALLTLLLNNNNNNNNANAAAVAPVPGK